MSNKKEIQRTEYLKIRMSKEEKEIFYEYAKDMEIAPSRLARTLLMMEVESYFSKFVNRPIFKAYRYYLKITNQKEILKKAKTEN